MSILFLGTCRVHGPADILAREGLPAWVSGHRAHAPRHLFKILRHLDGQDLYDERTVHLLSTRAFEAFLERRSVLSQLDSCRAQWAETDTVVIEISSFKDEIAKDGTIVDFFSRRDITRNAAYVDAEIERGAIADIRAADIKTSLTEPEPVMKDIRALLGDRRIVWLPHTFVQGAPAEVVSTRKQVHDEVQRVARELGDQLFDPSAIAESLGAERMFAEDWAHFSRAGHEALAQGYRRLLT